MKFIKNILLIVVCILTITSCSYTEEFRTLKSGTFSLDMPDYLDKMEGITETTPHQFGNMFRNFYIIVEEINKSDNPGLTITKQQLLSVDFLTSPPTVNDFEILERKDINQNGLSGTLLTAEAVVGDEAINEVILYRMLTLENEKKMYHLVLWTWKKWEEKYQEVIPKILESFKAEE